MSDITKIKVDGEPESSYQLYPRNEEFAKRAEDSQSDWNQNDDTQPDYVKNRPFYTGAAETVLVEESTVSFADDGGIYMAQFQSTFEAIVGETYKVYWDGSAYECTCADFNGDIVIGNLSIGGQGSDTGEPFVMIVRNRIAAIEIYTADTSASHTFSISVFAPEVVKIDPKYLPSPLIIDATNLPTNTSLWRELREKIDSAYKNRREILLNVYGDNSFVLPCVSWVNDTATFIYAKNGFPNLCIYILTAFTNDGGSLVKRIIAMQEEPM